MPDRSVHPLPVTSNILKLIAMLSMITDHIGAVLFPQYRILRWIGRLAFPIFVFLLTEGFFHTHNRRLYLLRLFLFALISEIPFDLAFSKQPFDFEKCNVFFTLAIGFLVMMMAENLFISPPTLRYEPMRAIGLPMLMAVCFFVADQLHTDYSTAGILAIGIGYCLQRVNFHRCIVFSGIVLMLVIVHTVEVWAYLALPFIFLYNGRLGVKNKALQFAFYAFYPAHLLVLYFIKNSIAVLPEFLWFYPFISSIFPCIII